ncbi:MAG: MBL fold metallo-hydrolase [Thermoleophilia bacterium]
MTEIAPGITMLDAMLGGDPGLVSSYLVRGRDLAVVDPGPETSARGLIEQLTALGVGADDLAWIVLTHIHLDHCGGTGTLARAFPGARVVVFDRAARHIAEPQRLVEASQAVYGPLAPLYGGLEPTDAERVVPAADGHRIALGNGVELEMVGTPGHARHHMSVLELATGTLMAGDALGSHLLGGGLYPNTPPSDADPPTGRASLAKLRERAPTVISTAHFGPVGPPEEALDTADRQLATLGEIAIAGFPNGGVEGVRAEMERRMPLEETVGDAESAAHWRRLRWYADNADGLAIWAKRALEPRADG